MKMNLFFLLLFLVGLHTSCEESSEIAEKTSEQNPTSSSKAAVKAVKVSGEENAYIFEVTIKSPDTGCQQYADWWEVVSTKGDLIYRRILAHSHVDEQPFTRSGGIIKIGKNQEIYIRAHMNTSGYGTSVFGGTITGGFQNFEIQSNFATNLATIEPLPTDCTF